MDDMMDAPLAASGDSESLCARLAALEQTVTRLEAELHDQNELIQNIYDAIIVIDMSLRILRWSRGAEAIYGWRAEEALGRSLADTIGPTRYIDGSTTTTALAALLQHGSWSGTVIQYHRSGREIVVESVVRIMSGTQAAPQSLVAINRDVTERARIEAHLRQAQKMESAGRLAGSIAYDFNNLLTAITGYTDLLLVALAGNEPARNEVHEIRKATERATLLTRKLLAFARKQTMTSQILNLNDHILELEQSLQRVVGASIKLVTLLTPDLDPVQADPSQIEQVLVNLATNARDAMPEGGTLTLRTANVLLDAVYARTHRGAIPGAYVMLAVYDTGAGMSAQVQTHLFEPFFTTKEAGQGTGLGLATCYGIIKQHGGYIDITSAEQQGTVVRIYLPRVAEPVSPGTVADSQLDLPRGAETVLLAEDEEALRNLTARVLRQQGYTVLEATDGVMALRAAQTYNGDIHLLVSDVVMPHLSGLDLARQMLVQRPGLKVLLLSGYNNDLAPWQDEALQLAHLQKPFTPLMLVRAVRELLEAR